MSRSDLIVPIRDRRRGRRYLTLRNLLGAAIVLVALFAVITIRSEMRSAKPGEFGRLQARDVPIVKQQPSEIVREAKPVRDETAADPMLVAPVARAQWLTDEGAVQDATLVEQPTRHGDARAADGRGVAIVGGPDGVAVVHDGRKKPVLSGGFGR